MYEFCTVTTFCSHRLKAGYRGPGPGKGYFPQISGFRVCVDRSRPNGERIVQMQMQLPTEDRVWEEIFPDKAYSVVVPDFIYRGGDGYDFSVARDAFRPGSDLKYLVLDAVIRALAAGEKIGVERTPDNARFAILPDGAKPVIDPKPAATMPAGSASPYGDGAAGTSAS